MRRHARADGDVSVSVSVYAGAGASRDARANASASRDTNASASASVDAPRRSTGHAATIFFPVVAICGTGLRAAAQGTEDIRDIRGPKFMLPGWFWPALAATAMVIALAAYGIRRWMVRRRRPRVLLPFEVALLRLEEIRGLMQPAAAREFSIAVSDVVRRYIEQRFDATATHRTTEEFLHDLLESSNLSLARHRALLSEFLQQCDLVKFAGVGLSMQHMSALHESARTFVLETAAPEPAAAGPNAPPAVIAPATQVASVALTTSVAPPIAPPAAVTPAALAVPAAAAASTAAVAPTAPVARRPGRA